jgi:N6-adenosine-specific RNA methylase IME4
MMFKVERNDISENFHKGNNGRTTDKIAEQKIRTQRFLGQLLKEKEVSKNSIDNLKKGPKSSSSTSGNKKLSDYSLSKYESSTFQKIATLPEDEFEGELTKAKEETSKRIELTTARMLRVAKKRERADNREKISKNNEDLATDGSYRIIYADPPWRYNDKQDIDTLGGVQKHYPTMSISELCEMPVNTITDDDAVLFLWTTSPLLEDSFKIVNSWGFTYKTSFVWDKIKHNMGHYNSVRHEMLLVCTKGSCTPDKQKLFDSVQSIERTEHSKKPEKFREIIDTLYLHGNVKELFSRNISDDIKEKHHRWDFEGNQA